MGLISLLTDVVGGGLNAANSAIQSGIWKEYFESGDMSGGILMKRGERISPSGGKNTKADSNLISSGSGIDVQEGQCVILVENGRIVEFCAEPGRYTFDASTAPSVLAGGWEGLKNLGKDILQQWSAGGQRFATQRVFYINMGEQLYTPIKWGSGNISFQHFELDLVTNAPVWKVSTTLQGNGQFTIGISDPTKFFKELGAQKAGADGDGVIRVADIQQQLKAAVTGKIRQAVGALSAKHIAYTDIPNHEGDITKSLNALLDEEWTGTRGIEIREFTISMLDADEAAKKRITEYQETVGYSANPAMANVNVQRTMAQGFAAAGQNAGANGIVGMGMGMGMMGGPGLGNMNFQPQAPVQPVQQPQHAPHAQVSQQNAVPVAAHQAPQSTPSDTWKCECGNENTGNFCMNCGKSKPAPAAAAGWTCTCGAQSTGKFCPECGTPKPQAPKEYICGKCGWKPADPTNPPKFCPECGDRFDDADVTNA